MMLEVQLSELPRKVSLYEAVEAAYEDQIRFAWSRLREGVPVLVRCDKQIVPFLQGILKKRLATDGRTVTIIDGRPEPGAANPGTRINTMVSQLRQLVNNTEPNKVFFLPYLDILTSPVMGGFSQEGKEIMTIIHENPLLVTATFEDPDFPLPDLIAQAFPARTEMLGIGRQRLAKLITGEEGRKFAVDQLNLMTVFKYVSGLNPIRLREIMGIFARKADLDPALPEMLPNYLRELRDYTACGGAALSSIHLDHDIAGYAGVKRQIRENMLSILQRTARLSDEKDIKRLETIMPRGLIFHGPPGTGKTLFAKGIAEALNAAIYIVSGPELKSKWVGEGEANIRRLFARARATAPAVIVFDELDSIAAARTGNTGDGASQAAHSMVNQLLTEMDGFRKEELVLVIGTTNFVASLDPAFLRPGRFEYQIEIPYPDWDDRRAILAHYTRTFELGLTETDLDLLANWTGRLTSAGTPYSGDHLNALLRELKRHLLFRDMATASADVLRAWLETQAGSTRLTPAEEQVVALHEAGHAMMLHRFGRLDEITKITLDSGAPATLGLVQTRSRPNAFFTESRLKAEMAIALGGYAAEKLVCGEVSTGAGADLLHATAIATDMTARWGMGDLPAPRSFVGDDQRPHPYFLPHLTPRVDALLAEALRESMEWLHEQRPTLDRLTAAIQTRRTLEPADLAGLLPPTTVNV
jgi:cell division protease FtsH